MRAGRGRRRRRREVLYAFILASLHFNVAMNKSIKI